MQKIFILISCIFFISLTTACQNTESVSDTKPTTDAESLSVVDFTRYNPGWVEYNRTWLRDLSDQGILPTPLSGEGIDRLAEAWARAFGTRKEFLRGEVEVSAVDEAMMHLDTTVREVTGLSFGEFMEAGQ